MEFTYRDIRSGLIKYFVKVEDYRYYRSKIHAGVVYFYSKKADYNVVRLSSQVFSLTQDEELKQIVGKMQKNQHHQPKVLSVVIADQVIDAYEAQPGYWELLTNEQNLKIKLEPYFARINKLKIESAESRSFFKRASKIENDQPRNENPDGEAFEGENNSEDSLENFDPLKVQKELKSFVAKTSANHLILTWVFLALFTLVPVSGIIVCLFLRLDIYDSTLGLNGLERLFTGGTNYTLTIAGHQWWRIFTWGFAVPWSNWLGNFVLLFIASTAFYRLTKYNETIIGVFKTFLVFLIAYLFTSFFVTIMLPDQITGGILPMVAISLGILISGIGVDTTLQSRYIRQKLIWPVIVLLFFPLFIGGLTEYVSVIAGIGIGAGVMAMMPHSVKHSKTSLIVNGLILAILILLPVIFSFIPRYTPATDTRIIYTLGLYVQHGFLPGIDYANNIMGKIGWSVHFEDISGIIAIVGG